MTTPRKEVTDKIRERNRAFVNEVNARTVCAHCGKQSVEWHSPEHVAPGRGYRRIANMARANYTTAQIQAEMDRCTPLCRRCHMAEDGRLERLIRAGQVAPKKPRSTDPCSECDRAYWPLRRGLCNACRQRKAKAS